MQVRKVVASSVMLGALSAAGLGLAGTASATGGGYHPPKKPTVTYSYQSTTNKTVVKDNGQVGAGNVKQTSNNSANVTLNQNGVSQNNAGQIPVNVNGGTSFSKFSSSKAEQDAKQRQDSTANYSEINTSANNAQGNGNGSQVNIGQGNENED